MKAREPRSWNCSMPITSCTTCATLLSDTPEPPSGCRKSAKRTAQFVFVAARPDRFGRTPRRLADGHVNAWRTPGEDLFEIHTHRVRHRGHRGCFLRTPRGNKHPVGLYALRDDATVKTPGSRRGWPARDRRSRPRIITPCPAGWARAFAVAVPPARCPSRLGDASPDPSIRPLAWRNLDRGWCDVARPGRATFAAARFCNGLIGPIELGPPSLSVDILAGGPPTSAGSRFSELSEHEMPLACGDGPAVSRRTVAPWRFDRIYGAFPGRQVMTGGAQRPWNVGRPLSSTSFWRAGESGRTPLLALGRAC